MAAPKKFTVNPLMTDRPEGYLLRQAAPGDVAAVQEVLDAAESAECGEPRHNKTRLEIEFRDPRLDLDRDVWVMTAPAGSAAPLAAVALVWQPNVSGQIRGDHYVHPDHRGRGLCPVLLEAVENRAVELAGTLAAGVRGTLVIWCAPSGECCAVIKVRGFTKTRESFEMRVDLGEELAAPSWPAGITTRPLRVGHDEPAVHAADEEAFAEHFMAEPIPYADWRSRHIDRPDFDPRLWLVAWDGDDVAGYAAAFAADDGGYVADLAVRRPWRRRGLGLALLNEEFRALAARGVTVVRLFVDAQNVTGAARLYEKAGMRITRRFEVFEKKLPLGPRRLI
jgi:mycothiol synthase